MHTALEPQPRTGGRPTLCTPQIYEKILKAVSHGSFINVACEAAGISDATLRLWVKRADEDKNLGKTEEESPYLRFLAALTRARKEAENAHVEYLATNDDWRARAFLLERGMRERWGKDKVETAPAVTITLPPEVGGALVEALRVASATRVQPIIEGELADKAEPA